MRLTLPGLLLVSSWFFCGGLLGLALQERWGHPGFFLGCLLGTLGGAIVTWVVLTGRLLLFFPLPPCRQGKCRLLGKDFVWKKGSILGYEGKGVYHYKCKCGDEYLRTGKKFQELLPDGTTRSYKTLVGFRTWADDRGKSE
jgi:hypothetical protein